MTDEQAMPGTLRWYREEAGVSVSVLAHALDMSVIYMRKIEARERDFPERARWKTMARVLGVSQQTVCDIWMAEERIKLIDKEEALVRRYKMVRDELEGR